MSDAPEAVPRRCGLVAIVGRPNVGKSTLLNALVGQKISITSRKAQTTRHRITGIRTVGPAQFVFVDTPGFQTKHGTALNRTLNRTVLSSLSDVDVVLFVVEAGRFGLDDAKVLALLPQGKPVLLIANKLDAVKRRDDVLPWLKSMQERHAFAEFVPMSARKDDDVQRLFEILAPYLPEGPWLHEEDALTDRSDRFLASEIVREKLFRLTGDELPYTSTVVIDKFEEEGNLRRIAATIVVERDAHKGMVIGAGRRAAQAHRQRGAPGARAPARRQGLPRAVGQGALRLGRRRGAPAQLRLRMTRGAAERRRPAGRAWAPDVLVGRGASMRQLSAYVLHHYDWSESSLILDLFTREQGRVAVAAKGAKRPYSQLRGVLLPFQRLSVTLSRRQRRCRGADAARGRMGRRRADARRRRAVHRLLPQRTAAEAAGAPGPAPRAVRRLCADAAGAGAGRRGAVAGGAARLRADAAARDRPAARAELRHADAAAGAHRGRLCAAARSRHRAGRGRRRRPGQAHAWWRCRRRWSTAAWPRCRPCMLALPALRSSLRALLHYHLGSPLLRTRQVMADVRKLLDSRSVLPMNPLVAPEAGSTRHGAGTALSVNVNKVALLRNTRPLGIPSVVRVATLALQAGADGITVHPRPDERHIRAADVRELPRCCSAGRRPNTTSKATPSTT